MSNFLAIATVTATLSRQLQNVIGTDLPGATVTNLRPDSAQNGTPTPRVNLYLYQVTPNATRRSNDLPTRRSDGTLVQRPQIAFDLHYLISFYGDDAQLEPQRLLGSIARTLHSRPLLTQRMIRDTIANPNQSFLASSNLAEALESVKFTPLSLDLEALSKLWSVFFQTPYALSLAYQANVVLIESDDTPQPSLPVRDRNLYILPIRQPIIEQVRSSAGLQVPISLGSTLVLSGQKLQGNPTYIRIGDLELTPESVTDTEIRVVLASGLRSGIQGIQVIHPLLMGTPPVPHRGNESNIAAFVLRPTIEVTASDVIVQCETTTDPTTGDRVTRCAGQITVQCTPEVGLHQRVVLFLNPLANPLEPTPVARSHSFDRIPPTERDASSSSLTFSIASVIAGTYLVRIQVDGAESLLTGRADQIDPRYLMPQVTIG